MSLKVSDDPFRRAGHALLDWGVYPARDVIEISILNMLRNGGEYLGPSSAAKTNWIKQPHYFNAQRAPEAGPTSYRIGPDVCNYLPPNTFVEIASSDGVVATEQVEWPGVAVAAEQGTVLIGGISYPPPPFPPPKASSPPAKPHGESKKSKGVVKDPTPGPLLEKGEGQVARRPASRSAMLLAAFAFIALLGLFPALGLMGIVGWGTTPEMITLEGHAGGPFLPQQAEILLHRSWYVAFLERMLFPGRTPFKAGLVPEWLNLELAFRDEQSGDWRLRVSPSRAASQLTEGDRLYALEVEFPLAWRTFKGAEINLRVSGQPKLSVSSPEGVVFTRSSQGVLQPPSASFVVSNPGSVSTSWRVRSEAGWLDVSPAEGVLSPGAAMEVAIRPNRHAASIEAATVATLRFENLAANEPKARQVRLSIAAGAPQVASNAPQTATPAPPETGVTCDRTSGNRFDKDRPRERPFIGDTAALSDDEIDQGLSDCQAAARGAGAQRRFTVQLGRLHAERAIRRARGGDFSHADADMRKAQELWQEADRRGSAYAARLMGALLSGETFNVGDHRFVQSDPAAAAQSYRRAMERGDIIGQRNYAARLLNGLGVEKDIPQGMSLLRDAMRRGDAAAGGVLGVALFTRDPPDVPKNAEEGWTLMKQAYCAHDKSREVVDLRIARGEKSNSEQPHCR